MRVLSIFSAFRCNYIIYSKALVQQVNAFKISTRLVSLQQHPGRNGGHLVRNVFNSFISRQASHNTSEAIKTYLLEKYTADSLVNFISTRGLQDEVDLVEGGHITLLRTEQEEIDARNDYEAAKAAGLIAEGEMGVRWLGNEELQKVIFFLK